jgi:hypothetical protein
MFSTIANRHYRIIMISKARMGFIAKETKENTTELQRLKQPS